MAKLIVFNNSYDEPMAIDPDHVLSVHIAKSQQIKVCLAHGDVYLKEEFIDVVEAINDGRVN